IRGCVVLAGGASNSWCWDGATWTNISSTTPVRRFASVFFDPALGATVGWGGGASPTPAVEMGKLDGSPVIPQAPIVARVRAAMAYDARRGQLVLFGGENSAGTVYGDTWESDGRSWVLRQTGIAPSARSNAAMAYDAGRGRIVLWGGDSVDEATWEWDGDT